MIVIYDTWFGLAIWFIVFSVNGWFTLNAWYIYVSPCFIWDLIHGECVLSSSFCENGRNVVFSMYSVSGYICDSILRSLEPDLVLQSRLYLGNGYLG